MRKVIPSLVVVGSHRTSNAVLDLIIGLMLLTLAREEAQVLNCLAGGGESAMRVNSSPKARLLHQSF